MARWEIYSRDKGECIFCKAGFSGSSSFMDRQINGVMHYIPRSQGGLGIAENGALGCNYHHTMLDNGADRRMRQRMKEHFRDYLKEHYPGWNEDDLKYDKWRGL